MAVRTRNIRQTVRFKASPAEVFEMLMDSRKHTALSGELAKIGGEVGEAFTAWDGHISGRTIALRPGARIVQAWRATGWPPDHYSIATFDIRPAAEGAELEFTQIGVPAARYSGHYRGWIETYWTPMAEIFETGRISETTRARIAVDRDVRIQNRSFRRRLGKGA
jgi:activator of HSP90 ATPase